ncbi:hypothetical protein [Bdellovibrio sp. NC01]|uniref:hypothetical protein n=1 Tax=Bdellovibrio sp. NC01 TaxID=2220073 RepID=UPI00115885C0|nr:hypothetical protein [Bdellovibrio sp. NC01]QDK38051.1 hypothetical protein DOE51_10860 [Bdellovibrio sp. NC01]
MKSLFSILSLLVAFTTSSAQAADKKLNCSFGLSNSGTATVEVRKVEGHPENLLLVVTIKSGAIAVEGLLAAHVGDGGSIWASGVVFNSEGAQNIINPETISIQGTLNEKGLFGAVMDDDRVLQHGFGAPIDCQ